MRVPDHLTLESRQAIEEADVVFAITIDAEKLAWLRDRNPRLEVLNDYYLPGQDRMLTYQNMADTVLAAVQEGKDVALVSYGHPGVYCTPSHKSLAMCREAGLDARMMPGISAMDCMYADLALDPLHNGAQGYEANDCLVYQRNWAGRPLRFLWQPNYIGVFDTVSSSEPQRGLFRVLQEQLISVYGPDHPWVVYQAAIHPGLPHAVNCYPLKELLDHPMLNYSTVVLPAEGDWQPPRHDAGDLQIVGLGRDPERQTTHAVLELLPQASQIGYLGLLPTQQEWLLSHYPQARPYDKDCDLLVLAGHPCYYGGASLARERPSRLHAALAPDDYAYCEVGFGPEDCGFQVVSLQHFPTRPEWLDPHATVLLLGDGIPDWAADFEPRQNCLFPREKPQPDHPLLLRANHALAVPRLRAVLDGLQPAELAQWKTMAMLATLEETDDETQLGRVLEWTVKFAQERLFEEAMKTGLDLSAPDVIPKAMENKPDSPFARWVWLRIQATSAKLGFQEGFRDGRELLELTNVDS